MSYLASHHSLDGSFAITALSFLTTILLSTTHSSHAGGERWKNNRPQQANHSHRPACLYVCVCLSRPAPLHPPLPSLSLTLPFLSLLLSVSLSFFFFGLAGLPAPSCCSLDRRPEDQNSSKSRYTHASTRNNSCAFGSTANTMTATNQTSLPYQSDAPTFKQTGDTMAFSSRHTSCVRRISGCRYGLRPFGLFPVRLAHGTRVYSYPARPSAVVSIALPRFFFPFQTTIDKVLPEQKKGGRMGTEEGGGGRGRGEEG